MLNLKAWTQVMLCCVNSPSHEVNKKKEIIYKNTPKFFRKWIIRAEHMYQVMVGWLFFLKFCFNIELLFNSLSPLSSCFDLIIHSLFLPIFCICFARCFLYLMEFNCLKIKFFSFYCFYFFYQIIAKICVIFTLNTDIVSVTQKPCKTCRYSSKNRKKKVEKESDKS